VELRGDVGLSEPCKPARFLQTGPEAGVRFAIGVTLQGETSIVRPMNIMFSLNIPKSDIVASLSRFGRLGPEKCHNFHGSRAGLGRGEQQTLRWEAF